MTLEEAEEILNCRKRCANKGVECLHDASMALAALMFSDGHASRDPEVEKLKAEAADWCEKWTQAGHELLAERELIAKCRCDASRLFLASYATPGHSPEGKDVA